MFLNFIVWLPILVLPCLSFPIINSHSNKIVEHRWKEYMTSGVCVKEATCTPILNTTCFGTALPYSYTSVALAEDSVSQFEVLDNLALWQGLKSVPRCWAVVQPLLCAVYLPKCENGTVFLPSQEMCRITRGPCKFVEMKHGWPSFLKCENKELFPSRCRNPLQEVKFNTSSKCISPLVETDNPDNWFDEVEGCGIQCQNPFFTEEEHNGTHKLIGILASVCFASTAFSVITFAISWKVANRYPGVIILYINICLAFVSFGWLIQFFSHDARREIVCSYDGTIRRRQPKSGEHLCSITFVLVYYFLMASIVWFVILTYAWHILFRELGSPKDIMKKKAYFHLVAWSIPLVLTVAAMAITEVDGDSMSGICFVGYSNIVMRVGFLLVPVALAAAIGGIFLLRVLYAVIKGKLKAEKAVSRVCRKIGIFSACTFAFIICTFVCHAYDFGNRKEWEDSLREYIVCQAMNSANIYSSAGGAPKCKLRNKPNVAIIQLHLSCLFGYGIVMSIWIWTKATIESWKSFLYERCAPSEKKSASIKRHDIIAKAFQRRHEINQGHISFSLNSVHEDPVGMNLDVNSVTSREISTSWAAALPQFLVRRNAIAGLVPFSPRHYSSASDVSRHISVDSFNQPTLDSLQISDQEYAHALRHQRRKTRKEREQFLRANRIAPWFPGSRRGSDTSLQSSLMAASIAAKNARVGAKVTKATSTGDLGSVPIPPPGMLPPIIMPPVNNRPQIQRPAINPPFTHGMTDNSHRLDSRVPSVPSALAGANSSQRYTPSQCSVIPNSIMNVVRPPFYGGSYDVLSPNPYGYMQAAGSVYPPINGMYPGYPFSADYRFNPYGTLPYVYTPFNNQYEHNILPLHPRVDSASETEFFPIILSDSEFTDAGHRSYDESQLMTAQRLMQEIQAQNAAVAAFSSSLQNEPSQLKPSLEPQQCAKTQFLKRMGSFNIKPNTSAVQNSRPPSGRKSPHDEAPPPSPVDDSSKSVNDDYDDGLDDVFEDSTTKEKNKSTISLPQASEVENIFKKLKSRFRRAASFVNNIHKEPEKIELSSKSFHSSLGQISKDNSVAATSQKDILKEKMLHESEGVSLIIGDVTNENVSR